MHGMACIATWPFGKGVHAVQGAHGYGCHATLVPFTIFTARECDEKEIMRALVHD